MTMSVDAVVGLVNTSSLSMTLSDSGSPIVITIFNSGGPGTISVTDSFSTPYTWTTITTGYISQIVGTGGSGTSGTITFSVAYQGIIAISFIGADKTDSGLSVIDGYGNNSTNVCTVLDPTASGEIAITGGNWQTQITGITGSPPATIVFEETTDFVGDVAWAGPTVSGSSTSLVWQGNGASAGSAICIVKAGTPRLAQLVMPL